MFRKLDFRGLIGQFDVKMANFRGLIAKIGHLRPILTSRTHQLPIFMDYAMGIVLRYVGGDLGVNKLVFWGLKGQFEVKRARFRGANS